MNLLPVVVLEIAKTVSTEASVLLEQAQISSSSSTFSVPATVPQTADLTAVMYDNN